MNISRVNMGVQSFKSQAGAENDYNKTNAGKLIGLGAGAGYTVEHILSKGGWKGFVTDVRTKYADALNASAIAVKDATGKKVVTFTQETLNKDLIKRANLSKAAIMSGIVISCVLVGSIIDMVLNSAKRNSADKGAY